MAGNKYSYNRTIEYIGPKPQRAKKRNYIGAYVMVAIAICVIIWFGKPLMPTIQAAQSGMKLEAVTQLIHQLKTSEKKGDKLAVQAILLAVSSQEMIASEELHSTFTQASAMMLSQCLKQSGVPIEQELFADMSANFCLYPQLWHANQANIGVDSKRVPNLFRYLARYHQTIVEDNTAKAYQNGDIIIWGLSNGEMQAGIVTPSPHEEQSSPWVVYCDGANVEWENALYRQEIIGHYRLK